MMKRFLGSTLVWMCLVAAPAAAQPPRGKAAPGPAGSGSTAEVQQLRQEIQELRSMLLRILELQQQQLDQMVRVVRDQSSAAAAAPVAPSKPDPAEKPSREDPSKAPPSARTPPPPPTPPKKTSSTDGTLVGTILMPSGRTDPVYVFVENVPGSMAKGKAIEIKQVNKQFQPRAVVVQKGTKVTFPNQDNIFHNVFSLTPGSTFDLGTYRAGDAPASYVFTKPGVVDVFCNLHSQMSASVLIVPNHLHTRVSSDGKFSLSGVPAGRRKVVAWIPNSEPISQMVEVKAGSEANVDFKIESAPEAKPHTDKFGQPYGSYK